MVKQIAIIIATIVCICLLIINGDKINKHEIDSTNYPEETKTDPLLESLNSGTNLNINKLSTDKQGELTRLVNKLYANNYFGAYLITDRSKAVLAARYGVANAQSGNIFRLNSPFEIGNLQQIYNDAMLLKLSEQGNLNLNDKITNYLPMKNLKSNLTVKLLLTDKVHLYVRSAMRKSFGKTSLLKSVTPYRSDVYNQISANEYVKSQLIQKITGTSYAKSFNNFIVSSINLSNSRVVTSPQLQINDVRSYEYGVNNKLPAQKNEIPTQKVNIIGYSIRMSMSDMAVSMNSLLQAKYLNKKNTEQLLRVLKKILVQPMDI